jgi:hypothetical protein
MPDFTQMPVRQRYGRPPVQIPAEIQQWADATYNQGVGCEVPADDSDQDSAAAAVEFARLLRLYAQRCGKSISIEFAQTDGGRVLRFQMREKRVYKKKEIIVS